MFASYTRVLSILFSPTYTVDEIDTTYVPEVERWVHFVMVLDFDRYKQTRYPELARYVAPVQMKHLLLERGLRYIDANMEVSQYSCVMCVYMWVYA